MRAMATKRRAAADSAAAKNQPLVDDIRLLGRILGDVIREQEGKEAFDLVERVRQLSVAYRLKRDAHAGRALDRLLNSLSGDRTVSVIRAFSYFSHLANIAEDRHHLRRRARARAPGAPAARLARRARSSGWRGAASAPTASPRTLAHAWISPVLTAHPTEVQRKSILDAERAIAELLAARDARARRARCGAQRVADPRPRHPALADADAAPGQAHRRRRDRERAQLLPRHLPGADSRALPRGRGGPARLRDRALLPHGQLDRRRPRRQPVRQRRDAAPPRWRGRARRRCATT